MNSRRRGRRANGRVRVRGGAREMDGVGDLFTPIHKVVILFPLGNRAIMML